MALGVDDIFIVCGVSVGTLFCSVALGVKTIFILCGLCVKSLFCSVALGVKTIFIVCGVLCWDLDMCCGSWCKDCIYCV